MRYVQNDLSSSFIDWSGSRIFATHTATHVRIMHPILIKRKGSGEQLSETEFECSDECARGIQASETHGRARAAAINLVSKLLTPLCRDVPPPPPRTAHRASRERPRPRRLSRIERRPGRPRAGDGGHVLIGARGVLEEWGIVLVRRAPEMGGTRSRFLHGPWAGLDRGQSGKRRRRRLRHKNDVERERGIETT